MMRTRKCPKCESTMAEGFVATEKSGLSVVSSWWEGRPKKTWFGIKLPKHPIEITTWRCQRCGFLEHYAEK